jgi:O-methyltransferase
LKKNMYGPTLHEIRSLRMFPIAPRGIPLAPDLPHDFSDLGRSIFEQVRPDTMTSPERVALLIEGKVAETLPEVAPQEIAALRPDTDRDESNGHEPGQLRPRLVSGGILVLDEYGCWKGSRRAVDEYFEQNGPRPLLARIDATACIVVKL